MVDLRAGIAALAITAAIWTVAHQAAPVRDHQVAYCWQDRHVAVKNPVTGEWMKGWAPGYAPCSEQDSYRNI